MKKKLTEPQKEVLRYLAKGHILYFDERGKYRVTGEKKTDGTIDAPLSGHSETRRDLAGGAHIYRPTIETLHNENLLVGEFDAHQRPRWKLNINNKEYEDEIKILRVEAALGVTRRAMKERIK